MPPKRELDPKNHTPKVLPPRIILSIRRILFRCSRCSRCSPVRWTTSLTPSIFCVLTPSIFCVLTPPFFASLPPPFFASLPPPFFASLPPHFMEMQPNEIPLEAFTAAGYVASQPVVPPREQPIEPPSAFRPFKASAAAVEPDESSDFSYEEQPPEPKRRRKAPKKMAREKRKTRKECVWLDRKDEMRSENWRAHVVFHWSLEKNCSLSSRPQKQSIITKKSSTI